MESTAAAPLVSSNSKPNPRNVEGIFEDFSSRRTALIRALTTDQEKFFGLCDPGNKESLCLYGHANGRWEVSPPEEMMPPDLPEPALGINLPRNKMDRADWLSLVASHSDSWLISVAFFFAAFLNAIERMRLFSMMNDLPTVYETLVHSDSYRCRSWLATKLPLSSNLTQTEFHTKRSRAAADENEEDEEDSDQTFCGACSDRYHANGFWICCDFCERWFHGKCVKITAAQAEHIGIYKCPDCISEDLGE